MRAKSASSYSLRCVRLLAIAASAITLISGVSQIPQQMSVPTSPNPIGESAVPIAGSECGQNQLVEMVEMGEMGEMGEKILPHLPHLQKLNKDQPLTTARLGVASVLSFLLQSLLFQLLTSFCQRYA